MLIPVLLGITVLAFGLGRLAPGDPVEEALAHVGVRAPSLAQIEAKRAELGLDDPLVIQYRNWLNRAVHGDLGTSCFSRIKISDEIARRLPVTLKVSLVAMAFTVILGIGLGVLMVLCAGGIWARCLNVLSVFLLSVPGLWLSIFLIVLFSEVLHLLPTSGQGTFFHLQLPSPDHLLGTDHLGRDILSRVMHGGRSSILIAVLTAGCAMLIGFAEAI